MHYNLKHQDFMDNKHLEHSQAKLSYHMVYQTRYFEVIHSNRASIKDLIIIELKKPDK